MKVGFIKPVHQVEWIANVVPVSEKDGKLRMCVDFRHLNKVCPMDDFPFLWIVSKDITKSRWLLRT